MFDRDGGMRTGVVSLMLLLSVAGSVAASETALPTYKEVFRYVADQEDLPTDEGSIFKLAVESNAEYLRVNPSEWFLVVRVDFLEGSHAQQAAWGIGQRSLLCVP